MKSPTRVDDLISSSIGRARKQYKHRRGPSLRAPSHRCGGRSARLGDAFRDVCVSLVSIRQARSAPARAARFAVKPASTGLDKAGWLVLAIPTLARDREPSGWGAPAPCSTIPTPSRLPLLAPRARARSVTLARAFSHATPTVSRVPRTEYSIEREPVQRRFEQASVRCARRGMTAAVAGQRRGGDVTRSGYRRPECGRVAATRHQQWTDRWRCGARQPSDAVGEAGSDGGQRGPPSGAVAAPLEGAGRREGS
jgi:hypothetical protein